MSFGIILPHRWRRQPTQPVGVNWSHPTARGLIGLWNFHGNTINHVSGEPSAVVGTQQFSAASGGFGFNNNQDSYVGAANLGNWNLLNELTIIVYARLGASDSYGALWAKTVSAGSNSIQLQREGTGDRVYVDAGGGANFTSGGGFAPSKFTGADSVIGFVWRDYEIVGGEGKYYGWINGRLGEEISSIYKVPASGSGELKIGAARDASTLAWGGIYYGAAVWNRALLDAESAEIGSNFWQLFRPIIRRIYVPSAGGGGSSDHALTESSAAADSLAAAAAFAAASAESSAAAETLAAILQAQASAAESVATSDTLAAAAQSSVAAGESAAAADTLAATGYQRGAPDADVDVGAWLASTGADLAALLRDADSGTYIYTTSKESAYLADVKRASGSDLDDPGADAGYEIVVELAGGYTPSGEIEVEVLQGATVIATRTISSPVAGQTYTWTLTEGEAATITNHSALRQRVTVH
jgi:hypothetical protein